jgi:hypothetical protein
MFYEMLVGSGRGRYARPESGMARLAVVQKRRNAARLVERPLNPSVERIMLHGAFIQD